MLKISTMIVMYAGAFAGIYGGIFMPGAEGLQTHWPRTDVEIVAALLLLCGMSCKIVGHLILLSYTHSKPIDPIHGYRTQRDRFPRS